MCYMWKHKRLKKKRMSMWMASGMLSVTGVAISVPLSSIALVVSGDGGLLVLYAAKSDITSHIKQCQFAYTSYRKVLTQLYAASWNAI